MHLPVTNEIYLSEIVPSDQSACVTHLQDPEIYRRTLRIPPLYTEQHFQQFMKIVEETTLKQGRPVHFAIRSRDGFMIGGLGLNEFEIGKSHRAEIGYWLAQDYWGRGIMTQVVRAACVLAFDELGLSKLTAHVFVDNAGSARVLEKCGFQQEGLLRQHFQKDGKLLDGRLFGLLKEPGRTN
jgi:[ribosomal protein S5]-alanine N-acetyltransferase